MNGLWERRVKGGEWDGSNADSTFFAEYIYRAPGKKYADIAKQQPGRARQNS